MLLHSKVTVHEMFLSVNANVGIIADYNRSSWHSDRFFKYRDAIRVHILSQEKTKSFSRNSQTKHIILYYNAISSRSVFFFKLVKFFNGMKN